MNVLDFAAPVVLAASTQCPGHSKIKIIYIIVENMQMNGSSNKIFFTKVVPYQSEPAYYFYRPWYRLIC